MINAVDPYRKSLCAASDLSLVLWCIYNICTVTILWWNSWSELEVTLCCRWYKLKLEAYPQCLYKTSSNDKCWCPFLAVTLCSVWYEHSLMTYLHIWTKHPLLRNIADLYRKSHCATSDLCYYLCPGNSNCTSTLFSRTVRHLIWSCFFSSVCIRINCLIISIVDPDSNSHSFKLLHHSKMSFYDYCISFGNNLLLPYPLMKRLFTKIPIIKTIFGSCLSSHLGVWVHLLAPSPLFKAENLRIPVCFPPGRWNYSIKECMERWTNMS